MCTSPFVVPKYQQVMLDYLGHSGYPGPLLDVVLVTIHTYMNNLYEEKNCKIFFFLLRCEKVLSLAPTWSPGRTKKRWQDGGSTPSFTYNYVTLSDARNSSYNMGPSLKTIAASDVDSAARWLHNVRRLMGLPGYAQEHF